VSDEERLKMRASCTRWLSGHGEQSMRSRLTGLAAMPEADGSPDIYGKGDAVQTLEHRVADLLGKPAARFVIKGVIAQQAALRAWSDDRRIPTVALHPLSHLDRDELNALERLHPLRPIRLGSTRPFGVAELEAVGEPIGVVTVELPLRRGGFALPEWEELVAISTWCRDRGIPLHIDGARLWESAPYYERSLADIAALADSVYLSFYKGLGGLAGSALVGSEEFLAQATPWLTRHGANVFATYPYVLSALDGLDRHLPRMADYRAKARSLAAALSQIEGVRAPDPQTNGIAVYLRGDHESLGAAALEIAARTGVWLFGLITPTAVPGVAFAEISVGAAIDAVSDDEATALITELVSEGEARTAQAGSAAHPGR
jgi:threonine aldolase